MCSQATCGSGRRLRRIVFHELLLLGSISRWRFSLAPRMSATCWPAPVGLRALRTCHWSIGSPPDRLAHVADALEHSSRSSRLNRLLAVNFASYLPDDLLVKTDRCTMANSVEARCPLLDTALVEYVASLPDELKIDGGRGKAILREAFADLIPPDIDRRPKTGFGVPLDAWFRGELREYVRDTLLPSSAASRPYLKPQAIEGMIDAHQQGRANVGHRLWTLVCFERWLAQMPVWTARQPTRYHEAPLRS